MYHLLLAGIVTTPEAMHRLSQEATAHHMRRMCERCIMLRWTKIGSMSLACCERSVNGQVIRAPSITSQLRLTSQGEVAMKQQAEPDRPILNCPPLKFTGSASAMPFKEKYHQRCAFLDEFTGEGCEQCL